MRDKHGKGWTRAGQYRSKDQAHKRADNLRPKFNRVIVQKGRARKRMTDRYATTIYRVWVK